MAVPLLFPSVSLCFFPFLVFPVLPCVSMCVCWRGRGSSSLAPSSGPPAHLFAISSSPLPSLHTCLSSSSYPAVYLPRLLNHSPPDHCFNYAVVSRSWPLCASTQHSFLMLCAYLYLPLFPMLPRSFLSQFPVSLPSLSCPAPSLSPPATLAPSAQLTSALPSAIAPQRSASTTPPHLLTILIPYNKPSLKTSPSSSVSAFGFTSIDRNNVYSIYRHRE